jgi:hypothetical protein
MFVQIGRYKDNDTEREVNVILHPYDTWNMDHTLALITLPMLKQLKDTKHGVPMIDYEDMPEHLQYISRAYDTRAVYDMLDQSQQPEWDDLNELEFQRQIKCWNWIMDEMIWAFEQILDDDNDEQFYSGESDIYFEKLENGYSEMKRGPNDTLKIDFEGLEKHNERIENGLTLFGKYYRSLWD